MTATLTGSWSRSDETSDFTWRFDCTARLTPRMNLELYYDDLTLYGTTFSYRPSDVLALSGSFDRDDEGEKNTFSSSVSWITSDTIRTSLSYSWEDSPQGSNHGVNGSATWELCTLFTLRSQVSYNLSQGGGQDEDGNSFFWSLQMNMRW